MGIKLLTDPDEVKRLYEFVKKYPVDYPDYFIWLEKCRRQLEFGEKRAVYATNQSNIIGSLIFQKDKEEHSVLELKNLRVAEEYSGKGAGSALEEMACSFGKANGFKRIRADTHSDYVVRFLSRRGYAIEAEEELYVVKRKEIVLSKEL
ncbi:MAG: GNAT family N-acetyltransferase [Candidatus Woesearchaeota archaeon]